MRSKQRAALLSAALVLACALHAARADWCIPGCYCSEDDMAARFADCSKRMLINVDSEMLGGELNVQGLDLSHNSLSEMSDDFPDGIKGRHRVLVLSIAHNAISSVSPYALRGYTSLRALDLSNNRISSLPARLLLNVPTLTVLSLEGNRLQPEQDGTGWLVVAPHLLKLSLARCSLAHLGETSLSRLPSLTVLDLSENQLTMLPQHLPPQLRRLRVEDNPLDCAEPDLRSILSKLEVVESKCSVELNDFQQPRRSEAMMEHDPQMSIFSGFLCGPVADDNSTLRESLENNTEFGDGAMDHDVVTKVACEPTDNWLHLWGIPALWAAIWGMLVGIMVSAWTVWCFSPICTFCKRRRSLSSSILRSESGTLLLGDSMPSLQVDDEPPGTPPPPYGLI